MSILKFFMDNLGILPHNSFMNNAPKQQHGYKHVAPPSYHAYLHAEDDYHHFRTDNRATPISLHTRPTPMALATYFSPTTLFSSVILFASITSFRLCKTYLQIRERDRIVAALNSALRVSIACLRRAQSRSALARVILKIRSQIRERDRIVAALNSALRVSIACLRRAEKP